MPVPERWSFNEHFGAARATDGLGTVALRRSMVLTEWTVARGHVSRLRREKRWQLPPWHVRCSRTRIVGSACPRGTRSRHCPRGERLEEQENDGEVLIRGGYDVLSYLRLGAEGRARYRLSGNLKLPGNRDWDAFAGPQLLASHETLLAPVTAAASAWSAGRAGSRR